MKKLNSKQYKLRRNLVLSVGTVVNLIIWFFIPSVITNTLLVHVGNGKLGTKYGLLLLLLIPMFCFLQKPELPEHTTDPEEHAKLEEAALVKCYSVQFWLAAAEELVVILIYLTSLNL